MSATPQKGFNGPIGSFVDLIQKPELPILRLSLIDWEEGKPATNAIAVSTLSGRVQSQSGVQHHGTHAYSFSGTYQLSAKIIDKDGNVDVTSSRVYVDVALPTTETKSTVGPAFWQPLMIALIVAAVIGAGVSVSILRKRN